MVFTRVQCMLIALMVGLAECATAPLQETKQFQQAFNAVDSVGQPLLDDLAIAERERGQRQAIANAKKVASQGPPQGSNSCDAPWHKITPTTGFIDGFCISQAPYISKIGDPPDTRTFQMR